MKTRTKRLLIAAIALGLICCSVAGWTTIKVLARARDLPNRIVIDGDGLANAFGSDVVQSYHEGLTNGDIQTQSQIIRDFITLADNDAAAQDWIRTEYSKEDNQSQDAELHGGKTLDEWITQAKQGSRLEDRENAMLCGQTRNACNRQFRARTLAQTDVSGESFFAFTR